MIVCGSVFLASAVVGYINAAMGDRLGFTRLGLFPRI